MNMKKPFRKIASAILLLTLITPTASLISADPTNLCSIYGHLTINGVPAEDGIKVTASIQGVLKATNFTKHEGIHEGIFTLDFEAHQYDIVSFQIWIGTAYYIPSPATFVIPDDGSEPRAYYVNLSAEVTGENQPPYQPSNPDPMDGALNVYINAELFWSGGDPNPGDTVTYDVYFGTISPPPKVVANQSTTSYLPGLMSHSTMYYWKIIAYDNHGLSTPGPIWDFTTVPPGVNNPPNLPHNPDPSDGATGVDITKQLSWMGGDPDPGDTVTYDVYFGTTTHPSKVLSNQSTTTYNPGTLGYSTVYYWKIVAWDNHGFSRVGHLWKFTTKQSGGGGGGGGGENQPPIANATTGASYQGLVGELITFDGSDSSDPDGTIVSWDWTFGDSTQGTGKTTTHAYTHEGVYTVTLTVTDDQGATDKDTTIATILVANNPPTIPKIDGLPKGNTTTMYVYTATSTDPDNDTIQYTFTWGDDTDAIVSDFLPSGTPYTAVHRWTTAGKYTITVTVNDSKTHSTGTKTVYIDAVEVDDIGYLTDDDGDGIYDTFHNKSSGITTTVQLDSQGYYMIDEDGDGGWDWLFNPDTDDFKKYIPTKIETPSDMTAWMILGTLLGIILILFFSILLIGGKKKKTSSEQPPAPPVITEEKPQVTEEPSGKKPATKKKPSSKKPGKK